MFTQTRTQSAYDSSLATLRSDRTAEYDLIAGITGRLRYHAGLGAAGFTGLVAALNDNRRLWTRLALDVANGENALSAELRAQLFYLGEFVLLHTPSVLKKDATIDPLIDINIAVMRGLSGATEVPT